MATNVVARPHAYSRMVFSSLRSHLRSAREKPALRPLVSRIDRLWWAHVIRRADIVDRDYVQAQLGRPISSAAAIRRYVKSGYREGLRLSPLFVDSAVGDHLPESWRVPALYAYLVADPQGLQVSPLWDAVAYAEAHPEALTARGGPVGHAWHRRDTDSLPFGPTAQSAEVPWSQLTRVIVDAASLAREGREAAAAPQAAPVARELIVALGPDEEDVDESFAEAVQFLQELDHGVAIVVMDDRAEDWTLASLLRAQHPRVRISRRRCADPAVAVDELIASSAADVVVVRGPNQTLSAANAIRLAEHVEASDGGALFAPVWLDADGTIAAVGATAEGRFLSGHPVEDLDRFRQETTLEVPALAGTTFAARRSDLTTKLQGADAAAQLVGRTFVALDTETRTRSHAAEAALPAIATPADELLRRGGWERADAGTLRRPRREIELRDGTTVPVLRWALQTAAPVGPRAEGWGDTHFARALAAALRRLGQEVVIDAYDARARPTRYLDDVTLGLRGPEPLNPSPFGVSLLWIISHPDEIGASDLAGFDAVFAASTSWAKSATAAFGVPVTALPQCTDATRFRPSGLARGRDILFVGTARGIFRPSIVEPIRAGIPVTVIGPDWRGWIPAERIAATGVSNDQLPALYEGAALVLNDHWPAMREQGFIGNRLFDVVAAGGRAISDDVNGIAELFGGAVRTWDTVPELIEMLSDDLDAVFPGEDELMAISARIRNEHSFDARARTLLDAALGARQRGAPSVSERPV